MAIIDNGTRRQYTATAAQTVFQYTFEIFVKEDVTVDQNGTILAVGTDYTVSGVGLDAGGNITLLVGATAGDILTIYRDMDLDRDTDYQQNGDFLADTVNNDFDRLWAGLQQNESKANIGIRPTVNDPILNSSNTELANIATRGGKALGFAADGTIDYLNFGTAGGSFIDATTTAAMTALSGLSVGDVVQTAEFSTGNDGGGTYDVVLTSSVTPNTFNIIIGVADALISFVLRVGSIANVKEFGAIGAADDTAAIQAALDANLNVFIPEGIYNVSTTLTFRANHIVRGAGIGLTEIVYTGTATLPLGIINLDNTDDACLSDFSLAHSLSAVTPGIVLIGNSDNVLIERVSVNGFTTDFWLDGAEGAVPGTLTNCRVMQCRAFGATTQYGIRVQNTQTFLLADFEAFSNNLDGVKLRALNDNLTIRGGVSYDNGTGGNNGNGIDFLSGGFETSVTDFECYGNDGGGILIKSSLVLQPTLGLVGNISLNNLMCHDNGDDGIQITRDSGGVLTDPLVPNIQINGGRFYKNGAAGLVISRCRNVNVTGAHCYDNQTFGVALTQALDICLTNVDITHNCLDGVTLFGMQISTSYRVSIIGGNIIGVDDANIFEESDYGLLTPTHNWSINVNLADSDFIHIDRTVNMAYNVQPQDVLFSGTAVAGSSIVTEQRGAGLPENLIFGGVGSSYTKKTTNENEMYWVKVQGYAKTGWKILKPVSTATAEPTTGTWTRSAIIYDATPDASGFIGWVCITSGTFSSATDATGDPDGSTAVIPGLADTSDFNIGDYVTVSAGMSSPTTPFKIIAKTSTTLTLSSNSTSAQTNVTISTVDPTFKTFGPISA